MARRADPVSEARRVAPSRRIAASRRGAVSLRWAPLATLLMMQAAHVAETTGASSAAPEAPAGVENPQRAWQNWTLNCQGCHRLDGTGSEGTAPSLAGTVAKFLWVPGGREYLIRVPGVATSPLSDADLAEVMNWMLWRFDRQHLPAQFRPFTASELGPMRTRPLRLEASQMRRELLQKAESSGSP
jgi:hypothetical protein